MRKKIFVLLFIFFFLKGCAPVAVSEHVYEPTARPTAVPAPENETPRDGGTLRLSMRRPETLNPILNGDETVDRILKLIFEPLAVLDNNLKAAETFAGLNFASDFSSVTVTVKADAIWSDGTPVSADDIIFTVDYIKRSQSEIYGKCAAAVQSCEKISAEVCKINFVKSSPSNMYALLFPVIPRHYYLNEFNPLSAKNMSPLGNGLFLFGEYRHLRSLSLSRSFYSYKGSAYIEAVEVLIVPDDETELNAFNRGLTDVYFSSVPEWTRHRSVKEVRFAEYPSFDFDFIGFNFNNDFFSDINNRIAIASAVDWDSFVRFIYLEHASRTYSAVNPHSWFYNPNAKKIFTAQNGVFRDEDEPPLTIIVNAENNERIKIAEALKQGMNAVGLAAVVDVLEFDFFTERFLSGGFDLVIGGVALDAVPVFSFIYGEENLFFYTGSDADQLIGSINASVNENTFRRAFNDLQLHMAEQLPLIPLTYKKLAVLTDARIGGLHSPSADNVFWGIEYWFIK